MTAIDEYAWADTLLQRASEEYLRSFQVAVPFEPRIARVDIWIVDLVDIKRCAAVNVSVGSDIDNAGLFGQSWQQCCGPDVVAQIADSKMRLYSILCLLKVFIE